MMGSECAGYMYNDVSMFVLQEYFMDSDLNRTHCMQYKYTLLHPLSSAEMSQVVGVVANSDFDCCSPSYPVIAWQTGVIRLHGPVTFGLQYHADGLCKIIRVFKTHTVLVMLLRVCDVTVLSATFLLTLSNQ